MTPLTCPSCGVEDAPRVAPGTGPHQARAVCAHCGRFLKWLPKPKEVCMSACVNRVVLLGTIGKYGIEVRYAPSGAPFASFTLVASERGQDRKEHATLIPCEVWGKKAEAAGELEAGDLVVFEGKLRKLQKGENQWELVVSGYEVTPLPLPAST